MPPNAAAAVEWLHAAQDVAATVRDYTKWDDNPASLTHFGESAVRAYQIAMTAPMMPVVLAADGVLQEGEAPKDFDWRIPKLPRICRSGGRFRRRWPSWRRCWLRPKIL